MSGLDHENIIKMNDSYEDKDKFYVVMELAVGGELFEDVIANGYYDEYVAVPIIEQVLQAVKYLHNLGIVHRDIKLENVLYKDKETNKIKIADFGESKKIRNRLKTYCGTMDYMAPEIIRGSGSYGKEVDMWAIGVMTYVLLCGYPAFSGSSEVEIFQNISQANYEYPSPDWDYVGSEAKNFIDSLLKVNPDARLTAVESLEHPWFKYERDVDHGDN